VGGTWTKDPLVLLNFTYLYINIVDILCHIIKAILCLFVVGKAVISLSITIVMR